MSCPSRVDAHESRTRRKLFLDPETYANSGKQMPIIILFHFIGSWMTDSFIDFIFSNPNLPYMY